MAPGLQAASMMQRGGHELDVASTSGWGNLMATMHGFEQTAWD